MDISMLHREFEFEFETVNLNAMEMRETIKFRRQFIVMD